MEAEPAIKLRVGMVIKKVNLWDGRGLIESMIINEVANGNMSFNFVLKEKKTPRNETRYISNLQEHLESQDKLPKQFDPFATSNHHRRRSLP